jgi:outer membrane protein assembly factor BamB
MPYRLSIACLLLLLVQRSSPAPSPDDWPGLWGPARNGSAGSALPDAPRALDVVWRRPVQGGYSEIAVRGGVAFTMELRAGEDFVIALDAATGKDRWALRVGPTYKGHGGSDDGPISTPAVEGDDLFALGPHGHLIAVDVRTGRERWRHDLVRRFGATAPTWGFAASPLVEGGRVIVPTAGPDSRGLLAFDRKTGDLAWNAAVATSPSYASAVAATIGGVRQVIAAPADAVFAVSPADGRMLWRIAGPGGSIEVANSPIVIGENRVLVSTWEQSMLIGLDHGAGAFTPKEVWRSPRLRSSNGPTAYRGGFLYGFAGEQLICVNAATGDVVWRERTGPGTLLSAGSHLVLLGQESGELRLANLTSSGFQEVLRSRVLDPGVRAVTGPSYAGGRLYVRNLKEIVAIRVRG